MNKASNEIKVNEKEKVMFPEIVVRGTKDKPYYEIKYYDVTDKQWHLGYGSYNLEYVMQWKEECLEVVEGSITNDLCEKIKERLKSKHIPYLGLDNSVPYGTEMVKLFDTIEIVNQVADIHGGEELHDRNKIYDYIKTQINPYGKPFQGSAKEFGDKIMDYIKNMPDVPDINIGKNEEFCEWMQDDGATDICDTECGNSHMFIDASPSDNKYEYCPYCGKKIKVVRNE